MKRNLGIDILKSVSMLFVVLVHIFGHGGILETVPLGGVNFYISNFVFVCIICAVDVFVICTGYLYSDRKYNLSNIVGLWLWVFFYSVLISAVLYFLGYNLTKKDLLESFFPVFRDRYWFFTQYFALFLFIPLLNKIASDKAMLKKVLVISFVLFSLLSTSLFKQAGGCSFLWFCVLYLIGAYIKLYYKNKKNTLLYYFLSVTVYSVIYIFIVYLVAKGALKQDFLY
ncbi:MAG: acyltransferase family protein, partial [Armatimonadetes bacterium]|nr:acyltransferase family protein [Candidatus Hippobium faecium]